MNRSPRDRIKNIHDNILRKIERIKRSHNTTELTNQDIALAMARYSYVHRSTMSDEEMELLDDLLTKLDQLHMDIINMYHWGGKTEAQIGEVFGRNRMWVSRRLREAYEMMRKK